MALYVANSTNTGIRLWVSLIWGHSGVACGPFAPTFRKTGWWQVNDGQFINLWNVNLLTVNPVGAFFAEQFAGDYRTWGDLGVNNEVLIKRGGTFNQCYDDISGCDQRAKFGQLAFNTAANMFINLTTQVPEQPNWEVFVFD